MRLPKKKSEYFWITCGVILFTILLLLIFLPFNTPTPSKSTLTPSPTAEPPEIGNAVKVIKHDDQADEIQINRLKNRQEITSSDTLAKKQILSLIKPNDRDHIIHTTPTYIIDYIPSLDFIQVQILTTDIDNTKTAAVTWFKEQGLSIEGICKIPVDFFVSLSVSQQMKDTDYVFSPLAPGCE